MIFSLSEAANLAIHALTYLAEHPELEPASTKQIAQDLGASENHLSKVFQRLAKADLVKSIRGPKGGFRLAKSVADISLLDIYVEMDGPIRTQDCLFDKAECGRRGCVFGGLVSDITDMVTTHFENTSLGDLIERRDAHLQHNSHQ